MKRVVFAAALAAFAAAHSAVAQEQEQTIPPEIATGAECLLRCENSHDICVTGTIGGSAKPVGLEDLATLADAQDVMRCSVARNLCVRSCGGWKDMLADYIGQ